MALASHAPFSHLRSEKKSVQIVKVDVRLEKTQPTFQGPEWW